MKVTAHSMSALQHQQQQVSFKGFPWISRKFICSFRLTNTKACTPRFRMSPFWNSIRTMLSSVLFVYLLNLWYFTSERFNHIDLWNYWFVWVIWSMQWCFSSTSLMFKFYFRMESYKYITDMLDDLTNITESPTQTPSVPLSPGLPRPTQQSSSTDITQEEAQAIVSHFWIFQFPAYFNSPLFEYSTPAPRTSVLKAYIILDCLNK